MATTQVECGEHDGTGRPCPTCDYCGLSECSTDDMVWNGETGCHVECERDAGAGWPLTKVKDGTIPAYDPPPRPPTCSGCNSRHEPRDCPYRL